MVMTTTEEGVTPLFVGTEEDALNIENADLSGGPDFFTNQIG